MQTPQLDELTVEKVNDALRQIIGRSGETLRSEIIALRRDFAKPSQIMPDLRWTSLSAEIGNIRGNVTGLAATLKTIVSDGFVSSAEKPAFVREMTTAMAGKDGLVADATDLNVIAERDAYTTAWDALLAYLESLTPAWDDNSVSTPISAATLLALITALADAKEALMSAITHAQQAIMDDIVLRMAYYESDNWLTEAEKPIYRITWASIEGEYTSLSFHSLRSENAAVERASYISAYGVLYDIRSVWLDTGTTNISSITPKPSVRFADYATAMAALEAKMEDHIYEGMDLLMDPDMLGREKKPREIRDYSAEIQVRAQLQSAATSCVPPVSHADYTAAVDALASFLGGLTPAWNDLTQDTPLGTGGGATLLSRWSTIAQQRQALQNGIFNAAVSAAATAQSTADGKIESFYQTTAPATASEGDLWFDTDDGNKIYTRRSGVWVATQDSAIGAAIAAAATAQGTADGKARIYYQTDAPTGLVAVDQGDLWVDTNDNFKVWAWNGSSWVLAQDWMTAKAAADAADAIARQSGNLIKNGNSEDPNPTGYEAAGVVATSDGPAGSTKVRRVTASGPGDTQIFVGAANCSAGDQIYFEALGRTPYGVGTAFLYLHWLDAAGLIIDGAGNNIASTAAGWTKKVVAYGTAPAGASSVKFLLMFYGATAAGQWAEFDALYAERTQNGVVQINSVDYLTNTDKIKLRADWDAEQQIRGQLDAQAAVIGVSPAAYDNAVDDLSADLIAAGAPAGWATTWPDGTTTGPITGIMTSLRGWWNAAAQQRQALQNAIGQAQATKASSDAISAAATDAANKANAAYSAAIAAAATDAANKANAAQLASQPHRVAWAYSAKPALPNAAYPAGYYAITTDHRTVQVNPAGTVWDDVLVAATGLFGKLFASQVVLGGVGTRLNLDPAFQDPNFWSVWTGAISFGDDNTAPVGKTVMVAPVSAQIGSRDSIQIDPTKRYRLTGWLNRDAGANGTCYLGVEFFDGNGNHINSSNGSFHYMGIIGGVPPAYAWTKYTGTIGPSGCDFVIPSNAKIARLIALLNYGGTVGAVYLSGYSFEELVAGDLIVDGAITTQKLKAASVTAEKMVLVSASLIPDACFESGQAGWSGHTGVNIPGSSLSGCPGPSAGQFNARDCINNAGITVKAGEQYYCSLTGYANGGGGGGGIGIVVFGYDRSGTPVEAYALASTTNTSGWTPMSGTITVGPDTVRLSVGPWMDIPYGWVSANGGPLFTNMVLRKMNDASLIVDGAITAQKLEAVLAIVGVIRSPNFVAGSYGNAPQGFKLSGYAFTTTFKDGSTSSNCYQEMGGDGNFGGYKVGDVTASVFGRVAPYTTPGTYSWVCPAGVLEVEITMQGGGGGGSAGIATYRSGGGGDAGASIRKRVPVTPGTSYTVVVGSGGQGTPAGSTDQGGAGGASSFGSHSVIGGRGGSMSAISGGNGTNGASAEVVPGFQVGLRCSGGKGGLGTAGSLVDYGGNGGSVNGIYIGGGGSKGTTFYGAGGGGASPYGPGGSGGANAAGQTPPSTAYGAGGGGGAANASTHYAGGNGISGLVSIVY